MGSLKQTWQLDATQLGLLTTLFFLAYTAIQLPAGRWADRFGRVRVLVIGYVVFGLGTLASGCATGFMSFLMMRVITGFGEGFYYRPAYGLASAQVSPRHRTLAAATINSGMAVGMSLGFVASSTLTYRYGLPWQLTFFLFGGVTLLLAVLIAVMLRDTRSVEERQATRARHGLRGMRPLLTRNHLLCYALLFCTCYGFFNILTWLPCYLEKTRHIPAADTGIMASIIPWMAIPNGLLCGYVADRLPRKKPLMILLALLSGICLCIIPYAPSRTLLIVSLIAYGCIGKLTLDPLMIGFIADHTPRTQYAQAYSLYNFMGMSASIVAPFLTGYIADRTASLDAGFYLSGILMLCGAIGFMWTTRH